MTQNQAIFTALARPLASGSPSPAPVRSGPLSRYTMQRMMRALLVLALLTAACGGEPTPTAPTRVPAPAPAPTEPPPPPPPPPPPTVAQMAGQWGGTMNFRFMEAQRAVQTRVDLQQADRRVTGSWRVTTAASDIRGEIAGTLDGFDAETRFRGTVTWNSETASGTGRCLGTATFTGSASPPAVRWESAGGWDFGATCSDPPRDVVWMLVRF